MVEVGNTPPSSLPLGLPPPVDIFGEVSVDMLEYDKVDDSFLTSSEYEEANHSFSPPQAPKALVSFLKDNAVSLLSGATVQTYFGPDNTIVVGFKGCFDSNELACRDVKIVNSHFRTPKLSLREEECDSSTFSDDLAISMKLKNIELNNYGCCYSLMSSLSSLVNGTENATVKDGFSQKVCEDDSNDYREVKVSSYLRICLLFSRLAP